MKKEHTAIQQLDCLNDVKAHEEQSSQTELNIVK